MLFEGYLILALSKEWLDAFGEMPTFEANLDAISQFIIITHDSEIFENSNIDAIYNFESGPEGTKVVPI